MPRVINTINTLIISLNHNLIKSIIVKSFFQLLFHSDPSSQLIPTFMGSTAEHREGAMTLNATMWRHASDANLYRSVEKKIEPLSETC